jgi:hypothetical protein
LAQDVPINFLETSISNPLALDNAMRLKRIRYRYKCVTAGEKLYVHLRSEFIESHAWLDVQDVLQATGRALELVDFFQQIAALNLAGRIVVAGRSFAERTPLDDPLFRQELKEYIGDTIGESSDRIERVYRLAEAAVLAASDKSKPGQLSRFERWAKKSHTHCYMCNASLDFSRTHKFFSYTCEHVWPRMYGGDSIEDNFLPSCADCNSRIKRDLASWSQVNVQALILGVNPSAKSLQSIDNTYNFAMHYRIAQRYAAIHNQTLKEAFMAVGPWTDVRVLSLNDSADFFNLANHDPELSID